MAGVRLTESEWLTKVRGRLKGRPYLRHVHRDHGDVHDIGRRVREVDPGYFVVYNRRARAFEVHGCLQRGDSYVLTVWQDLADAPRPVPALNLDARVLATLRETSNILHGDQPQRDMVAREAENLRRRERRARGKELDFWMEQRPHLAKQAWQMF